MPRHASLFACALLLALPLGARAGDAPAAPPSAAARADAERRLAELPDGDAAAAYRLALGFEAEGLADLAKQAYEKVIAADADHPAARRALGYEKVSGVWLTGDDLYRAKGFVRYRDRWMTSQEFAEATRPQREAAEQKRGEQRVLALLAAIGTGDDARVAAARRQMALEDSRFKLAPLAMALRSRQAALRTYAAEELGRLGDPLGVPPLLKRVIDDPDAGVRHTVALALREIACPSTLEPLVRALDSRYSEVRQHAAEAIGTLGDQAGMPAVIMKWEARSGDFPRVYFAQTNQVSYISDFDVEVAQTSFIADPIVGVLQEGVVEAVKVLATEQSFTFEKPVFHKALVDLAGTDLGDDVKPWRKFWNENKDRLLEERNEHYEQARKAREARGN